MKWIILVPTIAMLSACACCGNSALVDYRQVTYRPVVTTAVASPAVVVPVSYANYDPVTVIDDDPIDVTTTTVDYY